MKIITPAIDGNGPFRPFSMIGAVHGAISEIPVGFKLDIEFGADAIGEEVSVKAIRMSLSKVSDAIGKKYTTRKIGNSRLRVWRVA